MKRRDIRLQVPDHAVLRYLERGHGLDVEAVRRHLAGLSVGPAELGAVAVRVENVRLFLRDRDIGQGRVLVTLATVGKPKMATKHGAPEESDDG